MGRLADHASPEPMGKAVVGLHCRAHDASFNADAASRTTNGAYRSGKGHG